MQTAELCPDSQAGSAEALASAIMTIPSDADDA